MSLARLDAPDELQELRDRVDELERILGLTAAPEWLASMDAFGLSAMESKLACLFMHRVLWSHEALEIALYDAHKRDRHCSTAVDARVSALRVKLAPYGIAI